MLPADITDLLRRWGEGDAEALDRLFPLVYDRMRQLAHQRLRSEPDASLNTTALVHEAYLKLVDTPRVTVRDRGHFLGLASRVMRHLLVDHARRRRAAKRGGGASPVRITNEQVGVDLSFDELLALDDALVRLGALDARLRQVVECRFFGGLTEPETAQALGVTTRTVQRDWARARAWLYSELYPAAP